LVGPLPWRREQLQEALSSVQHVLLGDTSGSSLQLVYCRIFIHYSTGYRTPWRTKRRVPRGSLTFSTPQNPGSNYAGRCQSSLNPFVVFLIPSGNHLSILKKMKTGHHQLLPYPSAFMINVIFIAFDAT
jgi:hypothetical protein